MAVKLNGWTSTQSQTLDGAVQSEQRVRLERPVVEFSEEGARRLGLAYWSEVERSLLGLVRRDIGRGGLALRLLGRRPVLLRFGLPRHEVGPDSVVCRYPVIGGILARRPAGEISFAQVARSELELRSTISDFFPSLAARAGEPHWTGALYNGMQNRVHVRISRRYFARLIEQGQL